MMPSHTIKDIAQDMAVLNAKLRVTTDRVAAMQFRLSTSIVTPEKITAAREDAAIALQELSVISDSIATLSDSVDMVATTFHQHIKDIGVLAGLAENRDDSVR